MADKMPDIAAATAEGPRSLTPPSAPRKNLGAPATGVPLQRPAGAIKGSGMPRRTTKAPRMTARR